MSGRKTVLVIGENGVGKSSLINLIVGNRVANLSSSAVKGTFHVNVHEYEKFLLLDTIGVNEDNNEKFFEHVSNFIRDVLPYGISLIIYVMKKGRIFATARKTYEYYVKTMCKGRVPVLLVLTHCELVENGRAWYYSQVPEFKKYGMQFSDAVCGCAIDLTMSTVKRNLIPILEVELERTQRNVRNMMRVLALNEAWKPSRGFTWETPRPYTSTAENLNRNEPPPCVLM